MNKHTIFIVTVLLVLCGANAQSVSVKCPLYVYQNFGSELNRFEASQRVGDNYTDLSFNENYQSDPVDPERLSFVQIVYTPSQFQYSVGVRWWKDRAEVSRLSLTGFDISCAKRLTFWAKGKKGTEVVQIRIGGVTNNPRDSLQPPVSTGFMRLTKNWQQYTIDLTNKDLTKVFVGFAVEITKEHNPKGAVVFFDEIKFE